MNDFCYLCYQREKRNVPVFLAVEREEEEQEEDHALQMYTLLKDNELLKKEEVWRGLLLKKSVLREGKSLFFCIGEHGRDEVNLSKFERTDLLKVMHNRTHF